MRRKSNPLSATALSIACFAALPLAASAAQIVYTAETGTTSAVDVATSDGAQNGTFVNDVTINNDPAFGQHAYGFGGSAAYPDVIDIPGSADLGSAFTLGVSARTTSLGFQRLFTSYSGTGPVANNELLFDFEPDNNPTTGIGLRLYVNGVSSIATLPSAATDGQYHHYAVTYDNGAVVLYFDGQPLETFAAGSGAVTLNHNLRFGEDLNGGGQANEQFTGSADDITLWNTALSAGTINHLASDGAVATLINPVPAPATWALAVFGFGGIVLATRRRSPA